jgi:glycine oxidase
MQRVDHAFVARREPAAAPTFSDALWLPYVSNIRNPRLLRALKASLLQHPGFCLLENTGVKALTAGANRMARVACADGTELVADKVVVCAGAWSAHLLSDGESVLPVEPVRGQMLLFEARRDLINSIILKDGKYLIPRLDGHILAGSTTESAGFDKSTTAEALELLLSHAHDMVPALRSVPVIQQWAGLRPGSPGGLPFIGKLPGWNNLYVNAGHYRNGLVLAPASARLMADLLLRREPIVDPLPYDPARLRAPMDMI